MMRDIGMSAVPWPLCRLFLVPSGTKRLIVVYRSTI